MGRRGRKGLPIHGWLAIHKEVGVTSTRVVEAVRIITKADKAGHGGTLDPFSEGLLPIALGEATKTLAMVLEGDKAYRCWVRFGSETDTGDPTGTVTVSGGTPPELEILDQALPHFLGEQDQVPPVYSAIHVDGERAHERVRRGETVEMPTRRVVIHELKLESYEAGLAQIAVRCGKGTYMRALARDLGRFLQCPAHLERLLRTDTLGFKLEDGVTLDTLADAVRDGRLNELLYPVDRVLDDIPALRLRVEVWHKIANGQSTWIDAEGCEQAEMVRLFTPEGEFGAVGVLSPASPASPRRLCKPKRLFHLS
ncbi:MAG: tRNA pseudouridine(55) synthase TruB [Magnetococcales bacterium]|nr:tRNA pseudouridine(55) synthase TruB [Magnetococcales bacterium]